MTLYPAAAVVLQAPTQLSKTRVVAAEALIRHLAQPKPLIRSSLRDRCHTTVLATLLP